MSDLLKKETGFPTFSDFFGDDFFKMNIPFKDWSPAVNVIENDSNYEIEVAAPGVKKDEFELDVENGILSVKGKTEKEAEEKKKNYTRKEFSSRSFSKSLTLPENTDKESIQAKYQDGILKVTIDKSAPSNSDKKQILIT
jgi:HSP20 family protein